MHIIFKHCDSFLITQQFNSIICFKISVAVSFLQELLRHAVLQVLLGSSWLECAGTSKYDLQKNQQSIQYIRVCYSVKEKFNPPVLYRLKTELNWCICNNDSQKNLNESTCSIKFMWVLSPMTVSQKLTLLFSTE